MNEELFVDRLIEKIKEKNNPTVVGLDPRLNLIPDYINEKAFKEYGKGLFGAAQAVFEFNKKIIDAIYDIVPAVKPQSAFYEIFGHEGIKSLIDTIEYARSKGLIVICDGKRNDIGSTAEAYSSAYLGETELDERNLAVFGADALTVNPYLGYDGIKPFEDDCRKYGKGIFILVKTSNKSSGDIQDLTTRDGKSIYEVVAGKVNEWGEGLIGKYGYSSIGAVIGATYPEQARSLRRIMKKAYILVPGYGAQGGAASDAANCFDENGMGAIVNASRSVIFAYKSERYANDYGAERFSEAARAEAIRMREDINNAVRLQ